MGGLRKKPWSFKDAHLKAESHSQGKKVTNMLFLLLQSNPNYMPAV